MNEWDVSTATWSVEPVAYVEVGDEKIEVDINASFAETITRIARERGISRFNVQLDDGEFITPRDAPETFESLAGRTVSIVPVDKAGYC